MSINWQEVFVTIGTTVGGGAVLLAIAAWLIRTVLSHKLTRDLESFKSSLKANGDVELRDSNHLYKRSHTRTKSDSLSFTKTRSSNR